MSKDYYNILGVEKNSSDSDIKKAYRKLSKQYHPDINQDTPDAEEKFKEVGQAYEVLSNKEKKQNYDMYGNADGIGNGFGNRQGFNMNDIFSQFGDIFGNTSFKNKNNRKGGAHKGSNIRVNINLTLQDIFSGVNKKIKYKKNVLCVLCNGTGGKIIACVKCRGMGVLTQIQNTPFGRIQNTVHCGSCRGAGSIIVDPCKICGGSGSKVKEEIFEFHIPKGIMEGEVLVISGGGNYIKNGVNGDLLINIVEIPHQKFSRSGLDIKQTINLSYKDLVLGSPVEVEVLDGKIKINIKEGTQIGHILRVPGKGLKRDNQTGDMMIEIWLTIPKNIKNEDKSIIEQLGV